ncbi:MAG: CopG family transcriptional regulator [Acidobacteria bacterium]|nr:CopG family transcriptional regulator [Acidobacteriota bacterium]
MRSLTTRATVYLDPDLHKALRLKSIETSRSMSDLINDAIRGELAEDAADLAAFEARKKEPTLSFEDFVKELKRNGKL